MTVDPSMVPIAGDPTKYAEEFLAPTGATRNYADRFTLGLQALANRTSYNRSILLDGPIWLDLPSGLTTSIPFPNSRFAYAAGNRFGWLQRDVTDTGSIYWQLQLPIQAKLLGVTGYALCEPSTVGSLPATMPRIVTWQQPIDAPPAASSQLNEQIDASPDFAAFNAWHTIGGAWGLSPTLLETDLLIMQYKGMSGGGAVVDALKLVAIRVDIEPYPAP